MSWSSQRDEDLSLSNRNVVNWSDHGNPRTVRTSPLNARIEARDSLASVRILPRNLHPPDRLRAAALGHFINASCGSKASGRFAIFHVSVLQHCFIPSEKRERRCCWIKRERSCFRRLVQVYKWHSAVTSGRSRVRTRGAVYVPVPSIVPAAANNGRVVDERGAELHGLALSIAAVWGLMPHADG